MAPPFPVKHPPGRRAGIFLFSGCLLLGGFLASGCGTAVAPGAPPARLVVHNETGYAWRLEISPAGTTQGLVEQIAPHAVRALALPGGSAQITQSVATAGGPADLTRTLSCQLEPGRVYQWHLATLLSEEMPP